MIARILNTLILLFLAAILNAQKLPEMIKVEGGTFQMGNKNNDGQEDEVPVHRVTLSTFYMAKTETTVLQWKTFCEATGRTMPPAPVYGWESDAPIVNINWNDADAYVKWLSHTTGKKYRIPTEAEWEYAAKGGNTGKDYKFSGSDDPVAVAWYGANSDNRSHPVAKKQPNSLGLYDMTGNVWEWTNDVYARYDTASVVNPRAGTHGEVMVFKGGGLMEPVQYIHITMRGQSDKRDYSYRDLGLRVVCDGL